MKKYNCFLIILLFLLNTIAFTQNVGISDDGATFTPQSTSALEVKSTSRGVLVPRMTTAQRTAIASPASGLLLYDTDTKSFWYFDVSWQEIISTQNPDNSGVSVISDDDNDTKIQTEESTDEDIIRFDTKGSQRMVIDDSGNILMGDGTNQTKIEPDGTLVYEGDATIYDDLTVPGLSLRANASPPGLMSYNGSLLLYGFDDSNIENVYFVVQMPHSWKEGTDIYPHVHWTVPIGTALTVNGVLWTLEYNWVNVGDQFTSGVSTLSSNTTIAPVDGVTNEHAITTLGTIAGAGMTLSSTLVCRLYRDGNSGASDTQAGDALLLQIDFHYQKDTDGSRLQYTK